MNKNTVKRIAVIGPVADSVTALIGNYCGVPDEAVTVAEGIRRVFAGAKALAGEADISGKCPVTFYRADATLPDFKDYSMAHRTRFAAPASVLYPFGYGLETYKYTARLVSFALTDDGGATVTAEAENVKIIMR